MRSIPLLSMMAIFILVISCGGDGGGGGDGASVPPGQDLPQAEEGDGRAARLFYDSELSSAERQALDASTERWVLSPSMAVRSEVSLRSLEETDLPMS